MPEVNLIILLAYIIELEAREVAYKGIPGARN
jgi:hypothetical protein